MTDGWHIAVQSGAELWQVGPRRTIAGFSISSWLLPAGSASPGLALTFDQVYQQLEARSEVFIEPDGSFSWVSGLNAGRLDGNLYDRGSQLDYVELKGHAAATLWRDVLACCSDGRLELMIQWLAEGWWFRADDFLRMVHQVEAPST